MIQITIQSTAKDHLKQETANLIDVTHETVLGIKEAQEFLTDRYGKLPGGRNRVYVDDDDGNAKIIGFTHSFWNKDWSHDSKPWYQTDWITAVYVVETPVNILVKNNGTK